jgi:hypothetical protein
MFATNVKIPPKRNSRLYNVLGFTGAVQGSWGYTPTSTPATNPHPPKKTREVPSS